MTNAQFINLKELLKEQVIENGEDSILFEISLEGDDIILEADNFSITLYPDGTFYYYEEESEGE
jgi:hypothetical protein